jgi:hypothetical protein
LSDIGIDIGSAVFRIGDMKINIASPILAFLLIIILLLWAIWLVPTDMTINRQLV